MAFIDDVKGVEMRVISIHDRETIHDIIRNQLISMPNIWDKAVLEDLINKAIKSSDKRYRKMFGLNNKYKPHQGKREIARRLSKMS